MHDRLALRQSIEYAIWDLKQWGQQPMSQRIIRLFNALGVRDVQTFKRWGWYIAAALIVALAITWRDLPGNWYEATQTDKRPLAKVASWHYQLQKIDIDKIATVDADVVVIDYERAIEGGARVRLTPEEVAKLKVRPDGKRRIVLSYLSVGEAEEKRYYWNADWKTDPTKKPSWLHLNNCAWPGAWAVRFWEDGWKQIVYRAADSYLRKIISAGFDGVYLDRVDMFADYPQIATEHRGAAQDMINLVAELGQTARSIKPGFLVIPNNGIELLESRQFRRAIDGLGMEELLFSHKGTGIRNDQSLINENVGYLRKLQWDFKPTFTLEYLVTKESIEAARAELQRLNVIGGFPTRALDGGDPTAPLDLKADPGTPEFIKANCTKANSW